MHVYFLLSYTALHYVSNQRCQDMVHLESRWQEIRFIRYLSIACHSPQVFLSDRKMKGCSVPLSVQHFL